MITRKPPEQTDSPRKGTGSTIEHPTIDVDLRRIKGGF